MLKMNLYIELVPLANLRKTNENSFILILSETCENKKAKLSLIVPLSGALLCYSTVTDLARFLGWSTFRPRITAI